MATLDRRPSPSRAPRCSTAERDDLLDRAPVAPRLGRARLQPRQVQQLLDQTREPRRLLDDRSTPSSSRSRGVERRRAHRVAGGDDRGQRRAQVVGDGAQQRGLQDVRAPQRLRLDDLALQRARGPARRASSASSAGTTRVRQPLRRALVEVRAARRSAAARPAPTSSGIARLAAVARRARCAIDAKRRSSASRELRGPRAAAPRRRSRRRAACAPSRPRGRPPRGGAAPRPPARARRPATVDAITAAARKTPSATQFSAVGDVEAARRGDVEPVERRRARRPRSAARAAAPSRSRRAGPRAGRRRPGRPSGRPRPADRSPASSPRPRRRRPGRRGRRARSVSKQERFRTAGHGVHTMMAGPHAIGEDRCGWPS